MEIIIRKAVFSDIDGIMRLEKQCFTSEAWARGDFEYIISDAEGVHTLLVAEAEGEICGYMCGNVVLGEGEIGSVAVDGSLRRLGIGRRLLEAFMESEKPDSVFLEVRVSNRAAIALYRKLGFEEIAMRRGYYDSPPEDAVVMKKNLQ